MKKVISFILSAVMFTANISAAFALERNPMQELPKSEIFDIEGSEYTRNAYQTWLDSALPEVLANNLLNGNYGFVANCKNYWHLDKRAKLDRAPVYEDGEMKLPQETAKELFGISVAGDYVSVSEIVKKVPEWKQFTDIRGFTLITKDLSVINKKPAIEGNVGGRHYRSYYDVSIAIAEITWDDVNATDEDFAMLRDKWLRQNLIPDGNIEESYIKENVDATKALMALFNKSGEAPIFLDERVVFAQYQGLLQMAKTYRLLKEAGRNDLDMELLKSEIMTLFDFLYKTNFGVNKPVDSNWYYNSISYPSFTASSILYMYDDMPYDLIEKYVNTWMVRTGDALVGVYCVPFKYYTNGNTTDPVNGYTNYTNLLWQAMVRFQLAILVNDSYRANHFIKYCNQAFENVKNGADVNVGMLKDGVYDDGSFVFHAYYAYNLGYGNSYAATIADLTELTDGTIFDMKKIYGYQHIYDWIEGSWLPFIHGNYMMKIVQGREIPTGVGAKANTIITAIMTLTLDSGDEALKERVARKLKPIIKDYMDEYRHLTRLPNFSIFTYPTMQTKINDYLDYIESLPDTGEDEYSKVYYNMDKVVHKQKDFTFMLSMASERMDRYEAINSNGYTDWYISDGMTYTLIDPVQYVDSWWTYVDRYKLPGTTADMDTRNPKYSSYGTVLPNNAWAGGATNGKMTVASQKLTGNAAERSSKLEATKSYFMIGDKVVCIGTDINGGKGEVTTTVENVLLSQEPEEGEKISGFDVGYEKTMIDGDYVCPKFDYKQKVENPKWAWIQPDRGFVFFGNNSVWAERVASDKTFAGLSESAKNADITKPFMTLAISHGEKPKGASYAYAILPCRTAEETKAYAENPDIEIISQTSKLHAVKDKKTGTVMAAVMEPSTVEGFEFNTPCCAIIEPLGNGSSKIYVSDPTQKQKTVKVTTPEDKNVVGDYIKSKNGKTVDIEVDLYYGKTYSFVYGEGEFSEGSSESQNKNIITSNIKLKCNKSVISTNLNAVSVTGDALSYSIITPPEKGTAVIRENRLYYFPSLWDNVINNKIVILVKDAAGNEATYTITVN